MELHRGWVGWGGWGCVHVGRRRLECTLATPTLLPAPLRQPGWGEEEREERRAALRRVLNAAVAGNARGVHYYQARAGCGCGGAAWGHGKHTPVHPTPPPHSPPDPAPMHSPPPQTHPQGLHDVAAVLLFVCGERPAARLLAHLATCHLRDCTRADLGPATEVLSLLYPVLEQASAHGAGGWGSWGWEVGC